MVIVNTYLGILRGVFMTITERVKELLSQFGHGAQKDLSQHIGVTPTTLHNWLKFDRSIPAEYIVGMADF
jgi:hypothetical protein